MDINQESILETVTVVQTGVLDMCDVLGPMMMMEQTQISGVQAYCNKVPT